MKKQTSAKPRFLKMLGRFIGQSIINGICHMRKKRIIIAEEPKVTK